MNPITQAVSNRTVSAGAGIQLNSADVAAKEIDGEILVMNVANGMYYSLDDDHVRTLFAEGLRHVREDRR